MKKSLLVVIAALVLATLACSVDTGGGGSGGSSGGSGGSTTGGDTERDISGEYNVEGVNQDGSQYSGEATLTRVSSGKYNINWLIADQTQTGEGTLNGTSFKVTWSAGDIGGEGVYTLQSDGSLEGTWTQDGVDGQGTETLTPK